MGCSWCSTKFNIVKPNKLH